MTHRLHVYFDRRVTWYRRWHEHHLHPHAHWCVLGILATGIAMLFLFLGWNGFGELVPSVAQAQTPLGAIPVLKPNAGPNDFELQLPPNSGFRYTFGDLNGDGNLDPVVKAVYTFDFVCEGQARYMIEAYDGVSGSRLWSNDTDYIVRAPECGIGDYVHEFVAAWDLDATGGEIQAADGKWEVVYNYKPQSTDGWGLRVVNGETGAIRADALWPEPTRGKAGQHRGTIAYLDGQTPSIVVNDGGEYSSGTIYAFDKDLNLLWTWSSSRSYGAHMVIAYDLDGNGTDEIIVGGTVLNGDGTKRWSMLDKGYGYMDLVQPGDHLPGNGMSEIYFLPTETPRGSGRGENNPGKGYSNPIVVDQNGDTVWENTSVYFCDHNARGWAADVTGDGLSEFYAEDHSYSVCADDGTIPKASYDDNGVVFDRGVEKGRVYDADGDGVYEFGRKDGAADITGDGGEENMKWDNTGGAIVVQLGSGGSTPHRWGNRSYMTQYTSFSSGYAPWMYTPQASSSAGGAPQCTTTGPWQNQGCGKGTCNTSLMQQTRAVDPLGCATTTRCATDPQCDSGGGGPVCGQNGCEAGETAQSCPVDCGSTGGGPLRGELTCDGKVDVRDLGILFFFWGKSAVEDPQSTIKSACGTFLSSIGKGLTPPLDAIVNEDDLAVLLSNWGKTGSTGGGNTPPTPPVITSSNTAPICTPNTTCPDCYTSQKCPGVCSADGMSWKDGDAGDGCPNYPPVAGVQPFPHIASFTWGGAVPWYDARAGLMMTSSNSSGWADARKALNPNMILLTTRDINGGANIWETPGAFPEAAWVHTSKGQTAADRCLLYSSDTFLANYTNYAQPLFNGKKYNQYVGEWFASLVPIPPFDGFGSDGLWPGEMVCTDDVDLNSNGVNDYTEGINVDAAFQQGAEVVTQSLRDAVGNGYLLLNSGGWDDTAWANKNGMITEHASIGYPIDWWWWVKDKHDEFAANGRKPIILLLDSNMPVPGYGGTPNPTMNDFQFMRYVLTLMSLNDGYVSITDYEAGEHYWTKWYDEFDVKLGLATSAAQEVKQPSGQGTIPHVFVRFFQSGAVIHNSSASTVTVTDAQISGLSGYAGPYYRFLGGEDSAFNDGQQLGSVELKVRQSDPYLGDGIMLVKSENLAVISDIVIDNTLSGTSPGSFPATLTGFNQIQDCGSTIQSEYTVRCAIHYDSPPAAVASPNTGATAMYHPTIGISGQYEVFEWHGTLRNTPMASNV